MMDRPRPRNHFHLDEDRTTRRATRASSSSSSSTTGAAAAATAATTATTTTTTKFSALWRRGAKAAQVGSHLGGPKKTAASSSLSDSMMSNSDVVSGRHNSTKSAQSAKSAATTLTALSSLTGGASSSASGASTKKGKSRRSSRYEDEFSDGQLGINERELNSMNKHIPALKSHGKSATFRQHYYPEGGWGWVVCACCFLVNLLTYGIQLSFGILQVEIIKHCQDQQRPQQQHLLLPLDGDVVISAAAGGGGGGGGGGVDTGTAPDSVAAGAPAAAASDGRGERMEAVWIGSTNLALSHLLAPFLVALCRRKSTRLTAVVGGLVASLALLFASFARFQHQIFLSYGILFGVGCAMVRETSALMLSQYFKRRRELAEIYATTGEGVGVTVFANAFQGAFSSLGWRLGLQSVTGCVSSLFFLGLFYRSASLYHPQRRAILHLKDMSKRKGKDKNKLDSKPPYFDLAPLRSRQFQLLLAATAIAYLGVITPFFYFVPLALDEGLGSEAYLLQTWLGLASVLGSILFGLIALSKSQQCMISRQYLLQASMFGIGVSFLALTCVEGYHGYLLFSWMFGLFFGGFNFALAAFTLDRMRMRHFPRSLGYVQAAKSASILVGLNACGHINAAAHSEKACFYFAAACVFAAAAAVFGLACVGGQKSRKNEGLVVADTRGSQQHNNLHQMALHEMPSDIFRFSSAAAGPPGGASAGGAAAASAAAAAASARCTCEEGHNTWSEDGSGRKRPAAAGVKMHLQHQDDLIETMEEAAGGALTVVAAGDEGDDDEEEDDEDEDEEEEEEEDLKNSVMFLACISEENLFENLDVEYLYNGEQSQAAAVAALATGTAAAAVESASSRMRSLSEPDLFHSASTGCPTSVANSPLNRQKTWHAKSQLAAAAASAVDTSATISAAHATSAVSYV